MGNFKNWLQELIVNQLQGTFDNKKKMNTRKTFVVKTTNARIVGGKFVVGSEAKSRDHKTPFKQHCSTLGHLFGHNLN